MLKIALSTPAGVEMQRFTGRTFEAALRQAAESGVLKAVCLEKQIAFMNRALPGRPGMRADDLPMTPEPASASGDTLFPLLTTAISALVHETQRERGISSLYLSSGGHLFVDQLQRQWMTTDARRAELVTLRRQHAPLVSPRLGRTLEQIDDLLDQLALERGVVKSLQLVPGQVIERYSTVNNELLSVIDGLTRTVLDDALRPTALAWMALLHAKEKTGIERAQLATAFTWDRFADGQHATVTALIAASDSYLHLFALAAPRAASALLRAQLSSEVATTVTDMERVALQNQQGGFGINPLTWFASMSRKIDLLTDVEAAVRASLT